MLIFLIHPHREVNRNLRLPVIENKSYYRLKKAIWYCYERAACLKLSNAALNICCDTNITSKKGVKIRVKRNV